jgi:hypothetical protein
MHTIAKVRNLFPHTWMRNKGMKKGEGISKNENMY